MDNTFIAVCVGILTVLHIVLTAVVVVVLLQVRKAAVAVENLAVAAKGPVATLGSVADKIHDVVSLMTGWYRAVWMGIMKAVELWARPKDVPETHPRPQKENE